MDTTMSQPPPRGPLLTKVEVASLILGLEEAPPGLGMDISSLGHQELHVVFAAAFDGDVQGSLTWGVGEGLSPEAETGPGRRAVGCQCGNRVRGCGPRP